MPALCQGVCKYHFIGSSPLLWDVGAVIIPILRIRKLRQAGGHTISKAGFWARIFLGLLPGTLFTVPFSSFQGHTNRKFQTPWLQRHRVPYIIFHNKLNLILMQNIKDYTIKIKREPNRVPFIGRKSQRIDKIISVTQNGKAPHDHGSRGRETW